MNCDSIDVRARFEYEYEKLNCHAAPIFMLQLPF